MRETMTRIRHASVLSEGPARQSAHKIKADNVSGPANIPD